MAKKIAVAKQDVEKAMGNDSAYDFITHALFCTFIFPCGRIRVCNARTQARYVNTCCGNRPYTISCLQFPPLHIKERKHVEPLLPDGVLQAIKIIEPHFRQTLCGLCRTAPRATTFDIQSLDFRARKLVDYAQSTCSSSRVAFLIQIRMHIACRQRACGASRVFIYYRNGLRHITKRCDTRTSGSRST